MGWFTSRRSKQKKQERHKNHKRHHGDHHKPRKHHGSKRDDRRAKAKPGEAPLSFELKHRKSVDKHTPTKKPTFGEFLARRPELSGREKPRPAKEAKVPTKAPPPQPHPPLQPPRHYLVLKQEKRIPEPTPKALSPAKSAKAPAKSSSSTEKTEKATPTTTLKAKNVDAPANKGKKENIEKAEQKESSVNSNLSDKSTTPATLTQNIAETEVTVTGISQCRDLEHTASDKNPDKCRFEDVHCLDSSRVIIHGRNDFIHANRLPLPDQSELILTQLPMKNTARDFWSMVWQEKVEAVLVIVTAAEWKVFGEESRVLPLNGGAHYGKTNVTVQFESKVSPNLDVKVVCLRQGSQQRQVRWVHYNGWKHGAAPDDPARLWELQAYFNMSGIGRAASFALFTLFHQQLHRQVNVIDPNKLIAHIRDHRAGAIQSLAQIKFVCSAMSKHCEKKTTT